MINGSAMGMAPIPPAGIASCPVVSATAEHRACGWAGGCCLPRPTGQQQGGGGAAVLLPTPRPEEGAFILAAAQPLQQDPPPAVPQLPLEIPRAPIAPHHFFLLLSALLLLHFG